MLLSVLSLLLLAPPAAAVDVDGTVKGEVLDGDGLPVPGAVVTLISPDMMGGERQATADDAGRFRFLLLPPGTYTLRVEHHAFPTYTAPAFELELGMTVQLPIEVGRVEGEVVVMGSAKPVDTERASTGLVVDQKLLRDIPSGRDFQSAALLAPGVVGGGNPNMHGGFESSNQYYIDGVNTTDPMTNTFSMNMNWDAIESVQVITGGMDAEYGRAMGGAVNIVTKDGGNVFEGNTTLVVSTPQMGHLGPVLDGDATGTDQSVSFTANLGGPVLKDRLWFYLSAQMDRSVSTISFDPTEIPRDLSLYPMEPERWRSTYLFGKLTWQPNAANRLWLHVQGDPTSIDNTEQSPYTLPSGEVYWVQGGGLISVGHQLTPSDRVSLETQVDVQRSYLNYTPILWKDCQSWDGRVCADDFGPAWFANDPDGFNVGEYGYAGFTSRGRVVAQSALTVFANALGEHELKVGVQADVLSAKQYYPGIADGIAYYNHDGDPANLDGYTPATITRYDNDGDVSFRSFIGSAYVQDAYKPFNGRVTLRPGLRFDLPRLTDDLGNVVFSRLTIAPRFGAAWDLGGDGRTVLGAYYGRFYDTGFLAISDLLRKSSQGYSAYGWDDRTNDWSANPQYTVSDTFLAHNDLKNPWSDELLLTFGRDLGGGFSLSVSGIYKEAHAFWEDDEVNLIWNQDGSDVIGYRNGENVAIYRLRTPDDVYTRYTGVEVLTKQLVADNWSLIGSYSWSRSIGTNSADQATGVLDIPEQAPFESGFLAHDQTHVVKLTGAWRKESAIHLGKLGVGYRFGWDQVFASGAPYRHVVWNNYYGDFANYDAPNDGRYRLPAFASTDVRTGLLFDTEKTHFSLGVDVFNLFNDRTLTSVNESYDPTASSADQTFGTMTGRQSPRHMDVIIQGEF